MSPGLQNPHCFLRVGFLTFDARASTDNENASRRSLHARRTITWQRTDGLDARAGDLPHCDLLQ
jgi:hypothetical protein